MNYVYPLIGMIGMTVLIVNFVVLIIYRLKEYCLICVWVLFTTDFSGIASYLKELLNTL